MSRKPCWRKLRAAPSSVASKAASGIVIVPGSACGRSAASMCLPARRRPPARRARCRAARRSAPRGPWRAVVLAERHVRAVLLGAADRHDDRRRAVRDGVAQLGPGQVLEEHADEPFGRARPLPPSTAAPAGRRAASCGEREVHGRDGRPWPRHRLLDRTIVCLSNEGHGSRPPPRPQPPAAGARRGGALFRRAGFAAASMREIAARRHAAGLAVLPLRIEGSPAGRRLHRRRGAHLGGGRRRGRAARTEPWTRLQAAAVAHLGAPRGERLRAGRDSRPAGRCADHRSASSSRCATVRGAFGPGARRPAARRAVTAAPAPVPPGCAELEPDVVSRRRRLLAGADRETLRRPAQGGPCRKADEGSGIEQTLRFARACS